jgi:small subunit ribosomal protein S2
MAEFIFMENNGIHIIDLNKTISQLDEAIFALKNIVRSGRKIMFVATKKQAKDIVTDEAKRLNMPFVTERWLGGMLTNFATIRKSLKKLAQIEKLIKDEAFNNLAKRERLMITREKAKLEKLLGGIADLNRLPAALFVIDVKREHIAVTEAQKLNIPVFALVDTNSDPSGVDFPIPANDDAFKSISILTKHVAKVIEAKMGPLIPSGRQSGSRTDHTQSLLLTRRTHHASRRFFTPLSFDCRFRPAVHHARYPGSAR